MKLLERGAHRVQRAEFRSEQRGACRAQRCRVQRCGAERTECSAQCGACCVHRAVRSTQIYRGVQAGERTECTESRAQRAEWSVQRAQVQRPEYRRVQCGACRARWGVQSAVEPAERTECGARFSGLGAESSAQQRGEARRTAWSAARRPAWGGDGGSRGVLRRRVQGRGYGVRGGGDMR